MILINVLEIDATAFCNTFSGVLRIFGYIIFFVKIITPIMLVLVGMITMTKAIAGKDEEAIRKAQNGLIKKSIAAISVFLVASLVGLLMTIIGGSQYKKCTSCVNSPFSCNVDTNQSTND